MAKSKPRRPTRTCRTKPVKSRKSRPAPRRSAKRAGVAKRVAKRAAPKRTARPKRKPPVKAAAPRTPAPITLGRDFGDTIEVLTGVEPSESVVLNPSSAIASGDQVRVAAAGESHAGS